MDQTNIYKNTGMAAPRTISQAAGRHPYTTRQAATPMSRCSSNSTIRISDTDIKDSKHHSYHPQSLPTPPASPPLHPTNAPLVNSPFTSSIITLHVGGSLSPSPESRPVTFHVNADLLLPISPFFRAAFTTQYEGLSFSEAKTRTMTLPEERPDDIRFLLQWMYWTALARSIGISETHHEATNPSNQSSKTTTSTEVFMGNGVCGSAGLYHPRIDPLVQAYQLYRADRRALRKAALSGDKVEQICLPRPKPPCYGPLVRLFILADRYDVGGGLREDICSRVRFVGRKGGCVPGREDVELLWGGVGGGGWGRGLRGGGPLVGAVEGDKEGDKEREGDLKKVVLEMYAGLKERSFALIWGGSEHGDGYEWNESEGEDEWNVEFLRELCCLLHSKTWCGGGKKE